MAHDIEASTIQSADDDIEKKHDLKAFDFAELVDQATSQASLPSPPPQLGESSSTPAPSNASPACPKTAPSTSVTNHQSCLTCRSHRSIDSQALRLSLSWLLHLSDSSGRTIRHGLENLSHELDLQTQNASRIASTRAVAKIEYDRHYDEYLQAHQTWSEKVKHAKSVTDSDSDQYADAARDANSFKSSVFSPSQAAMTSSLQSWLSVRSLHESTLSLMSDLQSQRQHAPSILARKLIELAGLDPSDNVATARFIYTWIATSIRYDDEDRVTELKREAREDVDTILRGHEQCHGFVNLFKTMFDAAVQTPSSFSPSPKAQILHGACRRADGTLGLAVPRDTDTEQVDLDRLHGHAWNAFPLADGGYKLVDVTWGAPVDGGFDGRWFGVSNEEFGERHFPSRRQRFVDDDDETFADYQFREEVTAWSWDDWVGLQDVPSCRPSWEPMCFHPQTHYKDGPNNEN